MSVQDLRRKINIALFVILFLNFLFWFGSSDVYARWAGVPPVPSKTGALIMALGDGEFSFRSGALTLQGLGDSGGQITPLKDYDYAQLDKWFWLLNDLDPASDEVPMTAAYYFGATKIPRDIHVIVRYLGAIGQNPVGDKWRWLAQAVYLARHRLNDLDLALDLAYQLSKLDPIGSKLPMWARQMPAFVLKAKGDREDARTLIQNMLASEANLDPHEINFMRSYLVEQLGMAPSEVDAFINMRGK